jgi:hypothetical protein
VRIFHSLSSLDLGRHDFLDVGSTADYCTVKFTQVRTVGDAKLLERHLLSSGVIYDGTREAVHEGRYVYLLIKGIGARHGCASTGRCVVALFHETGVAFGSGAKALRHAITLQISS